MVVGHYAPAYALKARYPGVPLWSLCVAAQAPDILFYVLLWLGVERMRFVPGVVGPLALDLQSIPYTHSLATTLVGAAAVWLVVGRFLGRAELGWALGLGVASHWVADLLVHLPDLPLRPGGTVRVGLGLWRHALVGYAVEVGLLLLAFRWLRRALPTGRGRLSADLGFLVLVGIQTLGTFVVSPPASPLAFALVAEALYLAVVLLALPVDRALRRGTAAGS